MKVNIKLQVLELMQTLYEGIDYIGHEACIEKKEMLEQCVQCKSVIEDVIYKEVEAEAEIIQSFRECTNLMLNLEQVVADEKMRTVLIDRIMRSLEGIYEYVLNVISTEKQKAVFLPYKASMWDCFDTIYKAAKEDEQWEVVVMPIPYFTKDEQCQVVSSEYEGNQLPSYVEIVNYNEYDLEVEKPDVIFIHNPYDGTNRVTQVAKEYFSSELKKYTDKLVYIPYFCNGGRVDVHFTLTPGVRNSWRTFVENEEARQSYIQYNDSEKIVALGSPKNDRVKIYNKSNVELPETWNEICQDKVVFMYNTHLNSILTEPNKFIYKIRYVIDCFREREDSIILWRPHPLSMETIDSMQPKVKTEYLQVINEFKSLKNAIYDDTADLNRAIAMSDAYIGDGTSSVVNLYKQTGKPMFIFNINNDITDEEIERTLFFSALKIVDGELWFSAANFNALFKYNLQTSQLKYIGKFDEEDQLERLIYKDMERCGDKLFFIPGNGNLMSSFDMQSNEFKYYDLNLEKPCFCKFMSKYKYKDSLWLFPGKSNVIICFDTKTERIEHYNDFYKDLKKYLQPGQDILFEEIEKHDQYVWMISKQINIIVEFNVETRAHKIYGINKDTLGYKGIACDGDKLWLLSNHTGNIIMYSISDKQLKEINNIYVGDHIDVNKIFYLDGYMWCVSIDCNKLIRINTKSYEIEQIDLNNEEFNSISLRKFGFNIISITYDNEKLYLIPMSGNGILEIDIKTLETTCRKIKASKEEINNIIKIIDKNVVVLEKACTLNRFINLVVEKGELNINQKEIGCLENNAGQRIWEYIIEN